MESRRESIKGQMAQRYGQLEGMVREVDRIASMTLPILPAAAVETSHSLLESLRLSLFPEPVVPEPENSLPKVIIDIQKREVTGPQGTKKFSDEGTMNVLVALAESGKGGLGGSQIIKIGGSNYWLASVSITKLRRIMEKEPTNSQIIVSKGRTTAARYYLYADVEIRNGEETRRIINSPLEEAANNSHSAPENPELADQTPGDPTDEKDDLIIRDRNMAAKLGIEEIFALGVVLRAPNSQPVLEKHGVRLPSNRLTTISYVVESAKRGLEGQRRNLNFDEALPKLVDYLQAFAAGEREVFLRDSSEAVRMMLGILNPLGSEELTALINELADLYTPVPATR